MFIQLCYGLLIYLLACNLCMRYLSRNLCSYFIFFRFTYFISWQWHGSCPCHLVFPMHPLRPYLDYFGYLYQRMDPLSEQERIEVRLQWATRILPLSELLVPFTFQIVYWHSISCQLGYRDFLQSPLQVKPLFLISESD